MVIKENIWYEPGVRQTKKMSRALDAAIRRLAVFNDCGQAIMVWDGKSKGTGENIRRINESKKPYIVINQ